MNNQPHGFYNIPPGTFTAVSTLIGLLLACGTNIAQQNSLANFLLQMGQTLSTVAAQSATIQELNTAIQQQAEQKDQAIQASKQLDDLQKQLDDLKAKLKKT